jgi:hypothetical protein
LADHDVNEQDMKYFRKNSRPVLRRYPRTQYRNACSSGARVFEGSAVRAHLWKNTLYCRFGKKSQATALDDGRCSCALAKGEAWRRTRIKRLLERDSQPGLRHYPRTQYCNAYTLGARGCRGSVARAHLWCCMACRRFGKKGRPKKTPEVGEMERWQRLSCGPSACATIPSISMGGTLRNAE